MLCAWCNFVISKTYPDHYCMQFLERLTVPASDGGCLQEFVPPFLSSSIINESGTSSTLANNDFFVKPNNLSFVGLPMSKELFWIFICMLLYHFSKESSVDKLMLLNCHQGLTVRLLKKAMTLKRQCDVTFAQIMCC